MGLKVKETTLMWGPLHAKCLSSVKVIQSTLKNFRRQDFQNPPVFILSFNHIYKKYGNHRGNTWYYFFVNLCQIYKTKNETNETFCTLKIDHLSYNLPLGIKLIWFYMIKSTN